GIGAADAPGLGDDSLCASDHCWRLRLSVAATMFVLWHAKSGRGLGRTEPGLAVDEAVVTAKYLFGEVHCGIAVRAGVDGRRAGAARGPGRPRGLDRRAGILAGHRTRDGRLFEPVPTAWRLVSPLYRHRRGVCFRIGDISGHDAGPGQAREHWFL